MRRAIAADAVLLRHRTVVWVIGVVAFAAIGVLFVQTIGDMAPPTPDQLAQAEADYQTRLAEWEAEHEQWQQACIDDGGTAEQCTVPAPNPESFEPWQADYSYTTRLATLLSAALLAMTMFVIAALFVGGDFASGAMSTWLTHLPNRTVVFVSKLVTVGYLALCASVLVFGAMLIVANVAARVWQVPIHSADLTASFIAAGRGALLVLLSSLLGAGATFATRRAGLAIGLAAAYVVLNRLTFSFNIGVGAAPFMDLIAQAQAWVGNGFSLTYWSGGSFQELALSPSLGGVAWGVVTIAVLTVGYLVQRFREHP